jgi:arginine:ornithine antiporter / lysine permease
MILAGGMKFVLLSCLLYAPGTLLYFWARREQGQRIFRPVEMGIFLLTVAGFVGAIYGLASGAIVL